MNTIGKSEDVNEDCRGTLERMYSNINFVDPQTVASLYLNPAKEIGHSSSAPLIFPFGCNSSQMKAVRNAMECQLSVIQGPPGTGKTQTILNIIANLILSRKSILVVSSNNSATRNVYDKLKKYGLDFLVAPLGSKSNKCAFIENQPEVNHDLALWQKSEDEIRSMSGIVAGNLKLLEDVFSTQESLAICRQEIAEIRKEKENFEKWIAGESFEYIGKCKMLSRVALKYLRRLNRLSEILVKVSDSKIRNLWIAVERLKLTIECRLGLRIRTKLTEDSVYLVIAEGERLFFESRINEYEKKIRDLESLLSKYDSTALVNGMTENSESILKARLAERWLAESRKVFNSIEDLFKQGEEVIEEYPVVLSTTFSAKNCFNDNTIFDYVIMDEASQVAIETGMLALTCARNAVIVGDTMQLPNVVKEEDVEKMEAIRNGLEEIWNGCKVKECYNCGRHSFLSSVLDAIPDVPQTLLKEHYRCHPDIINFCNQKFYGGNLLIMTRRGVGDSPLLAVSTSEGHHSYRIPGKGRFNQREIDVMKEEIIPQLPQDSDVGIIAPYNCQVDKIGECIPGYESATVHKFQGREKDAIIFSVTDDKISEFADDANLLNVAVSRAKKVFGIVVSGNDQKLKGNIHDLCQYIRYHEGKMLKSGLLSVFDFLHSNVGYKRGEGDVSEFESENITNRLILKILSSYPQFRDIASSFAYPLRYLLAGSMQFADKLSEEERRYISRTGTHVDFMLFNKVSKAPVMAIETDGYTYHRLSAEQRRKDDMKDRILGKYGLPIVRLLTTGHSEERTIVKELNRILNITDEIAGKESFIGASLHV